MDVIIPALIVAGIYGGLFGSFYVYNLWRSQYWKRIANRYLHDVKISGFWTRDLTLQGRAERLTVQIADSLRGKGRTEVVIEIPGPPDFYEVRIRREDKILWQPHEIVVGSESFDKTFFVEGPMRLVLALLDAETRSLLIQTNDAITSIGSQLEISRRKLLAETMHYQLPRVLPLLLSVGDRLAQPVDVKQRLVQNATRDPEPGVRIKNLLLLAREFPGDSETRKVLRAACSDPSPEVRLLIGRALGAEGLPVLVKLTEDLEDDAVSAEAVSMLGRELPSEHTQDILRCALERHCHQTALACMNALSRDGDASAVGVLVKAMEHEQEKLAVVAAQILQKIGSPEAEGPLILALQREQPALRIAAANALARVGSTAAVLPLKETAERFPRDRDLGQATRQAIAEIQLRLPGASPGQLSIAGAEAGQLSLAGAEAGQLSIATDPTGQLSISDAEDKPEES